MASYALRAPTPVNLGVMLFTNMAEPIIEKSIVNLVEFFTALKDDLAARYRSSLVGPLVVSLLLSHWPIIVYLTSETHKASEAIQFIEKNSSLESLCLATFYAIGYIVIFPWIELALDWLASRGRRLRNDFQTDEREQGIARRKIIAKRHAKLLELELENVQNQAKITDIDLVRFYHSTLGGDNFSRWVNDLRHGPTSSQLHNAIVNYFSRANSIEGRFINSRIQEAHEAFLNRLSTLGSALDDMRKSPVGEQASQLARFGQEALDAQRSYREIARAELNV